MKKALKVTGITLLTLLIALIVAALCYVLYVVIEYDRIEDNLQLEVSAGNVRESAQKGEEYSIVTYNIGFGAYSPEYSFFLDSGEMLDGTQVTGIYAKGLSKEDVQKNTDGAVNTLKGLGADFYFVQEVDVDGDRSYHQLSRGHGLCQILRSRQVLFRASPERGGRKGTRAHQQPYVRL